MRTLVSLALLSSIAGPAFAQIVVDVFPLPEPGILGLIGIGVVAIVATYRRRK